MYGEHSDGGMTEIESHDVNFIEDDFPSINEAKQDLQLYELQELEGVIPSLGEGGESQLHPKITKESGSDLTPSGSKPLDSDTQGSKVRRSKSETIPRHHFEIEGEFLYMIHWTLMSLLPMRKHQLHLLHMNGQLL